MIDDSQQANRMPYDVIIAGASCAGLAAALALSAAVAPDPVAVAQVTDNRRFLSEPEAQLDASMMKPMTWRDLATLNDRLAYAWRPALEIVRAHPVLGAG